MQGKKLVEQVDIQGDIVLDYDTSISTSEIFSRIKNYFPKIYKSQTGMICGVHKKRKFAIRAKNITYLGTPHPIFKKRIQIANDLKGFYVNAVKEGCKPILLGIYTYKNTELFCDFNIDDYVNKKAHNSSAHVYTGDLSNAVDEGIFQKTDFFGNKITVFRPDAVGVYLDDLFDEEYYHTDIEQNNIIEETVTYNVEVLKKNKKKSSILNYANRFMPQEVENVFQEFFSKENKTWHGIECYKKMISDNYRNKFQSEWAGFFLEYEFEYFIKDNNLANLVTYAQDKSENGIDLDLYFPTIKSYGDLKAHSDHSKGIQGNDWETVFSIIDTPDKNGHIYYIICEHSTIKDKDCGYEVTLFWNKTRKKADLMSYSGRMKNSVKLKKAYILDINYNNKQFLTMFKQGVNSNGKLRAPKIMIEHDNLDKFIIWEYEF